MTGKNAISSLFLRFGYVCFLLCQTLSSSFLLAYSYDDCNISAISKPIPFPAHKKLQTRHSTFIWWVIPLCMNLPSVWEQCDKKNELLIIFIIQCRTFFVNYAYQCTKKKKKKCDYDKTIWEYILICMGVRCICMLTALIFKVNTYKN